jgi:Primase X
LDKNNFKSERSFKLALSTTLENIKDKLVVDSSNGYPTVIETGGGYHVYQPIYCPTALENVIEFQKFDRPSEQFLRFAKDNLSKGKADKQNNPSFKSCLLRIPGSINSKYVNTTKVKIVQQWNGVRPPIPREFIEEFRTYLIQKKIDEAKQRQKILNLRRNKIRNSNNFDYNIDYYYEWIDKKILANPFPDYRKIIVDVILAPYLINIKKLSYQESYDVIREWLDKCNSLQKLDNYNNFVNYRIHSPLKTATQKGIGPMSFYKIKTDMRYSNNLYLLILQK